MFLQNNKTYTFMKYLYFIMNVTLQDSYYCSSNILDINVFLIVVKLLCMLLYFNKLENNTFCIFCSYAENVVLQMFHFQ